MVARPSFISTTRACTAAVHGERGDRRRREVQMKGGAEVALQLRDAPLLGGVEDGSWNGANGVAG